MVKKKKLPTVNVSFRIVLDVGKDFTGRSLEDAIAEAKALKVSDLIDFTDLDHNDSSIRVSGVFEHQPLCEA